MPADDIFARSGQLLGETALGRLKRSRVAVFGLGGVGGWCAEALVRTGVGHLMLVDSDCVEATNVNRQVMATSLTVGEAKASLLAKRLAEINPAISLDVRNERYTPENTAAFGLESYDVAIDAIDSLESKVHLARHALAIPALAFFSSMGAACRRDVFAIRKSVFRKVEGDGLARAMRRRFRESGGIPERDFMCVWSTERPAAMQGKGSIMPVTAAFGMALAALAIESICAAPEPLPHI
ncbi:MAG: tRNA threonylcarbamoyladenosine dehydratase [Kiritimatiellae bacterium]|nr:tRNA threonylcarbamoyladenosine dehydratase [Kiritimatiellia bacterium]